MATTMEKHIQTVLQALAVALLIWQGTQTIEMGKSIAVLTYQVGELSKKSDDFLTRAEADQRAKARDGEISDLKVRMQRIENKTR